MAAFGRQCTGRVAPPPTVSLFGAQFLTWRGIPLIPSDKVPVADGKTKIILSCSLAVQSDDALAVVEEVEIGKHHVHPYTDK